MTIHREPQEDRNPNDLSRETAYIPVVAYATTGEALPTRDLGPVSPDGENNAPSSDGANFGGLDDDELARIQIGSDGGPHCD